MTSPRSAHVRAVFDPPPVARRRLLPPRWALWTLLVLGALGWFMVSNILDVTRAVEHRDAARSALKRMATQAMPAGATNVATGFNGGRDAYAIGDLSVPAARALVGFGPDWGGAAWDEIPGTATATTRSYLSSGQDRILDVKATPCPLDRPHCPAGGSTVVVDVSIGGPKS